MTDPLKDLDEASRPKAPKLPQATDAHRQAGRHLAAIHRHYLHDMARIKMVLDRIEAGDAPPEHLHEVVLSLEMAENYRGLWIALRAGMSDPGDAPQHRRALHVPCIEARASAGFGDVVAKLRAEHKVVHARSTELERAATALMEAPTEAHFAKAATAFRHLEATVRSHFHYEETELEEAIGVYLDGV